MRNMLSNIIKTVIKSALLTTILVGCGSKQHQLTSAGLLVDNGVANPDEVKFIIYQGSTWIEPQPELFPLLRPIKLADKEVIQTAYRSLNHPRGAVQPRTASNSRLGFVTREGHVVIFAVGGGSGNCESAKADLTALTRIAFPTPASNHFDITTIPSGKLTQLAFYSDGGIAKVVTSAQEEEIVKAWRQLQGTYNPLSLRGNIEGTRKELKKFLEWVPNYVEVRLKKPVSYEAIVVPPDLDPKWPPDRGDNRSRLKKLEYDTAYVARLPEARKDYVRFAFYSSKTGDCLFTDAVDPRAITGYTNRYLQANYGPDLYNELVKQIKKQQGK